MVNFLCLHKRTLRPPRRLQALTPVNPYVAVKSRHVVGITFLDESVELPAVALIERGVLGGEVKRVAALCLHIPGDVV